MTEAPSNKWPIKQAALRRLKVAKEPPEGDASYAAQLAWWGLETGGVETHPQAPNWPNRSEVEMFVQRLFGEDAETASRYLL